MPDEHSSHLKACKVVIIDEHQAVRELLKGAMTGCASCHYEVTGMGGSVQDAVDLCRRQQPDVLNLEMVLPDGNGVEVLNRTSRELPGLRVVFFTACEQISLVTQAIGMGANGYVLKSRPLGTLAEVVARACAGGRSIDPALLVERKRMAGSASIRLLTNREREVTRLIARGKTTKEAATALGISAKTLDKHRSNLMRKLGVHDAVGLTHYAIAAGLISLN